ncbi:unnamed protein product [Amoebophrya sp. A25]|nr:unnamed protein product [Amoebophrya sp. A25]|eukprot:GSA25T00026521001.1
MKYFSVVVGAIVGAEAAKPSFATGQALGAALSEAISAGEGSKISAALLAGQSFLKRPSTLNLHVGETAQTSSSDRAATASALMALESGEARFLETLSSKGSFLRSPLADLQRLGGEAAVFKDALSYYSGLVDAGGVSARKGLVGLLQLASLPNARVPMATVLFKCSQLAKKESTSDADRELAGSIITYLTNMPVAFQSSDVASGSYGHTNIVLPAPSRVYGTGA